MFITEMTFSGKHYYRQEDLITCLEACKAMAVESIHMDHNATSGTASAWWTYQKISISFKVTFATPQEMLSVCGESLAVPQIPKYDQYNRPVQDNISHKVYGELIRILENTACMV